MISNREVPVGDQIFINDGLIAVTVLEVGENSVRARSAQAYRAFIALRIRSSPAALKTVGRLDLGRCSVSGGVRNVP